jgi:hypothetical protein
MAGTDSDWALRLTLVTVLLKGHDWPATTKKSSLSGEGPRVWHMGPTTR